MKTPQDYAADALAALSTLKKMVVDFEEYETAHNGPLTTHDAAVVEFLKAIEGGRYAVPKTSESEGQAQLAKGADSGLVSLTETEARTPALVSRILNAVAKGDAPTLRRIADAVRRVAGRSVMKRGKRTFSPAKPKKAALLELAQKTRVSRSLVKKAKAGKIAPRTAQRMAKKMGLVVKRGRKKLPDAVASASYEQPQKRGVSDRELIAAVNAAYKTLPLHRRKKTG